MGCGVYGSCRDANGKGRGARPLMRRRDCRWRCDFGFCTGSDAEGAEALSRGPGEEGEVDRGFWKARSE